MKRWWWIAALAILVLTLVLALVVPGIGKKSKEDLKESKISSVPDGTVIHVSPEERSLEQTSLPDTLEESMPSSGWRMHGSQVQWWINDRLWKSVSLDFVTDDPLICQLDIEKAQITCGSDQWQLQIEADCISLLPCHNKDE